jgi:hypothetical protein
VSFSTPPPTPIPPWMHHDQHFHNHQNKVLSRNNRAPTRESKGEPLEPNGEFHTHVPTRFSPSGLVWVLLGCYQPRADNGSPGGCRMRARGCVLGEARKGDEEMDTARPRRHRRKARESREDSSQNQMERLKDLSVSPKPEQSQRQRQRQPTVPCDSRVPTVAVTEASPTLRSKREIWSVSKRLGPAWP